MEQRPIYVVKLHHYRGCVLCDAHCSVMTVVEFLSKQCNLVIWRGYTVAPSGFQIDGSENNV